MQQFYTIRNVFTGTFKSINRPMVVMAWGAVVGIPYFHVFESFERNLPPWNLWHLDPTFPGSNTASMFSSVCPLHSLLRTEPPFLFSFSSSSLLMTLAHRFHYRIITLENNVRLMVAMLTARLVVVTFTSVNNAVCVKLLKITCACRSLQGPELFTQESVDRPHVRCNVHLNS